MQFQWIIKQLKEQWKVFFFKTNDISYTTKLYGEEHMHKMWNRKQSHVSASQCSVTIPPLWDKETEWAKVSLFR